MAIMTILHTALKVNKDTVTRRRRGRRRLTCFPHVYLFNHKRAICAGLEYNTRRCCWRYAGANCQIKPRTLGQVPAAVARQLEAVTARRRAGIIAEKLAKDLALSRGTNDTVLQLLRRWHCWTFCCCAPSPALCTAGAWMKNFSERKNEGKKEKHLEWWTDKIKYAWHSRVTLASMVPLLTWTVAPHWLGQQLWTEHFECEWKMKMARADLSGDDDDDDFI